MKDVPYETRSDRWAKARTVASIVSAFLAVVGIGIAALFAQHVLTIEVTPELDLTGAGGLLETWHKDHESETTEDWLGPFLLRGENASITWAMKGGVIDPGEEAQLCTALDRSCIGPSVVVAQQVEFNLHDGGLPEEGWYYLYNGAATGQLKSVVIYLYY